MSIYLAKFIPLCSTAEGQRAAARFNIPAYVDGSCRREPDFECEFPSISALCRGKLFAPQLDEGDDVVYITTKNFYGETFRHWRIVARLRVIKRFASHQDAAKWYHSKIRKFPSNCMVKGNAPLPLSHTSRGASQCAPGCGNSAASLQQWNKHYQRRANTISVFLVCESVWSNLSTPAILTDERAFKILGGWKRVRSRNPIQITKRQLKSLESAVRITRSRSRGLD